MTFFKSLAACTAAIVLLSFTANCKDAAEAPAAAAETAPPNQKAAQDPPSQPKPEAKPKPLVNTLKWTTASEVDNFGFDIYRGDSEEGPFTRINETPVTGAGNTDEPNNYQYVDDTIDPKRAYYYYVESISLGGEREKFTPVFKAPPKIKPEDTSATPSEDEN